MLKIIGFKIKNKIHTYCHQNFQPRPENLANHFFGNLKNPYSVLDICRPNRSCCVTRNKLNNLILEILLFQKSIKNNESIFDMTRLAFGILKFCFVMFFCPIFSVFTISDENVSVIIFTEF